MQNSQGEEYLQAEVKPNFMSLVVDYTQTIIVIPLSYFEDGTIKKWREKALRETSLD